jgi:hypothetical protein
LPDDELVTFVLDCHPKLDVLQEVLAQCRDSDIRSVKTGHGAGLLFVGLGQVDFLHLHKKARHPGLGFTGIKQVE